MPVNMSPSTGKASEMSNPSGMPAMPMMMEHAEDTITAAPLVNERVLARFCQAVQEFADRQGSSERAALKIRELKARLSNLRNLASLCRLAILGHPHSWARVADELYCISVDFPDDPIDEHCCGMEEEDEPDNRVYLAAAVDLFAGAAFVSKDDREQRDRFIIGIVRAIEAAIAFPVTFAPEAAAYVGEGTEAMAPLHAAIVIANATQRLIESDQKCIPKAPASIRMRLECLARKWMQANPVDAFFHAISGPKVECIEPDDVRVGDLVTLQLRSRCAEDLSREGYEYSELLRRVAVMFCPHQPAEIVSVLENGFQVRVPEGALTGPIAIIRNPPDLGYVHYLLDEYADEYQQEWPFSIFGVVRIDLFCYPEAFGPPRIEIIQVPRTANVGVYTSAGPLGEKQSVGINDTVVIRYRVTPAGSDANAPLSLNAPGGDITQKGPGVLVYKPARDGTNPVELTWGDLKVSVPISVGRNDSTGGLQ
jgi:hypothetical protein